MSTLDKVWSAIGRAKDSLTRWTERMFISPDDQIPSDSEEDKERLASWVKEVYEDARKWREKSFQGRMNYMNPMDFWKDARLIEQGLHWEVWGRRNATPGDEWKQELVDSETENQVRMRKSYLAGAWHDITVTPNIKQISDILDEERAQTGWTDMIIQAIHTEMVEGTVHFKEILDKSEDPRGVSKTLVVENASIFPTPFATGLSKTEGTWALVYATMQTEQGVLEAYPKLDRSSFSAARSEIAKDIKLQGEGEEGMGTLTHTRLCDVLECFFDDPTIEGVPAEESREEIAQEHKALELEAAEDLAEAMGVNDDRPSPANMPKAKVEDGQNHKAHVEAHILWLEQFVNRAQLDEIEGIPPEYADKTYSPEHSQAITKKTAEHIQEHQKMFEVQMEEGIPSGYRKKYPFGRKVTVVSGIVADDENIATDYKFDWRRLWRKCDMEKLPGFYWGRGLVEVMWQSNKVLDTMLSRTADTALSVGNPKAWFNIQDKQTLTENKYNTDPLDPGYYQVAPPVFKQGVSPRENMEIYNTMKADTAKKFGISDVSYGESPSASSSGKLVDILLQQSEIVVSGEANQRLNEALEDIVETKLMMYKQFYTEPRWYFIHGQPQAITVSDILKTFIVEDKEKGTKEEHEVPGFQVRVAPNSNFPRAWEIALGFMLQLANTETDDGVSIVPRRALADMLAVRFPGLAPGGEYYREAEATALGKQVMAQQQAKEQEEIKTLEGVKKQFQRRGLKEIMGSKPTNGDVNGQAEEIGSAGVGER